MFTIDGHCLKSRLLLGTALYPSIQVMQDSIRASGAEIVTVSLKRQSPQAKAGNAFWEAVKSTGCHVLPNTAGCRRAQEAITLAHMSREIFETTWIKLEVTGDDYTLQPDPFELLKAAEQLVLDGFVVLPYCTEDLVLCRRLVEVGCEILMPWAAPIGSGRGIVNPVGLAILRERFTNITLIIDAGLGAPSHAALAMEMGMDAVLLNSAVAKAGDPVAMAEAFREAVSAGRKAFSAGLIPPKPFASSSTSLTDTVFWHQGENVS